MMICRTQKTTTAQEELNHWKSLQVTAHTVANAKKRANQGNQKEEEDWKKGAVVTKIGKFKNEKGRIEQNVKGGAERGDETKLIRAFAH